MRAAHRRFRSQCTAPKSWRSSTSSNRFPCGSLQRSARLGSGRDPRSSTTDGSRSGPSRCRPRSEGRVHRGPPARGLAFHLATYAGARACPIGRFARTVGMVHKPYPPVERASDRGTGAEPGRGLDRRSWHRHLRCTFRFHCPRLCYTQPRFAHEVSCVPDEKARTRRSTRIGRNHFRFSDVSSQRTEWTGTVLFSASGSTYPTGFSTEKPHQRGQPRPWRH